MNEQFPPALEAAINRAVAASCDGSFPPDLARVSYVRQVIKAREHFSDAQIIAHIDKMIAAEK